MLSDVVEVEVTSRGGKGPVDCNVLHIGSGTRGDVLLDGSGVEALHRNGRVHAEVAIVDRVGG